MANASPPARGAGRHYLALAAAASDAFERGLAQQESTVVIAPQVEGETRRGRDYVRVAVVMTVAVTGVGEALTLAWRGFCQAAASDLAGWDLDAAAAEVRPRRSALARGAAGTETRWKFDRDFREIAGEPFSVWTRGPGYRASAPRCRCSVRALRPGTAGGDIHEPLAAGCRDGPHPVGHGYERCADITREVTRRP